LSYDIVSYARIIADWLDRPNKEMSVQDLSGIRAVVGTAIGEVRKENQDRVAVARFASARKPEQTFALHVLCDGIGGMKHGAQCAELAIGSLIDACMRTTGIDVHTRLRMCVQSANEAVH
jgi:PPM family protein phosphatase